MLYFLHNETILPMPLPRKYERLISEDEDLSQNDTNGDANIPEDIGKQTRDRRSSNASGKNLINSALLFYIVHKIATNKRQFPVVM